MNVTPLGQYLLREVPDAAEHVRKALAIQTALAGAEAYRNLGDILLEKGWIGTEVLERCLIRQREDCLAGIELFEALSDESLARLARESRHQVVPAHHTVFRHGDRGDSYFIIVSGSVTVTRTGESGKEVLIATLGPGEGFGEIALLTGADRAATVTTGERTVLISVLKPAFDSILAANQSISQGFIRVLAERLMKGSDRIAEAKADEEAYRAFISEQNSRHKPRIIGSTVAARRVLAEIDKAAAKDSPVLVQGEAGTELWDAAALVYRGTGNLFTYDTSASSGFFGQGPDESSLSREMIQISALFGRTKDALPSCTGRRIGLLQLADGGAVIVENIESLSSATQEMLADYLSSGTFRVLGDALPLASKVRVLATTSADLGMLAAQGRFSLRLLEQFGLARVTLPPLRKRKKDIRETVEHYIGRYNLQMGLAIEGIGEDAYKAIMSYDWPGNHDELASAVRRAMSLCKGTMLSSENIFLSPPPVSGQVAFDLFRFEKVKGLFLNRSYPRIAQLVVAPFIALVIAAGLFGTEDPAQNAAIVLTWGYWEPLAVLGSIFIGRIWCGFCPMGPAVQLINRNAGLKKKVPLFVRKYGAFLSSLGIAAIFWAESAAHMLYSPQATALLVLAIVALAAIFGFVYERRVWCRYVCPLGGMIGFFSRCSAIELRSHYNICNNSCAGHDCFAGNARNDGCPLFEGPFSLRSNQNCMLCGNCVKACPNNSPVLNLRIPGQELWATRGTEQAGAFIGAALIGTQLFRGIEHAGLFGELAHSGLWWLWSAAAITGLMLGVLAFAGFSGKQAFPLSEQEDRGLSNMAYSFIPLAAAFEISFQLGRLLTLGGMLPDVIGHHLGAVTDLPAPVMTAGGIKTLQTIIMLIGLCGSLFVARRFSRCLSASGKSSATWPVLVLGMVLTGFLLAA